MPSLVDDEFWRLLEPLLLQPPRRYRHPGRKRLHSLAWLHQYRRRRIRYERRADIETL